VSAVGCVLAIAIAGCGGGDDEAAEAPRTTTAATKTTTSAKPATKAKTTTRAPAQPPGLGAGASGRAVEGRKLVIATGCLACHQIGGKGASRPGQNLDGVGARRSDAELRQALVSPPSRMPSYEVLSDGKLDQIVAYLSSLGGGDDCPGDSDCG
jgi:mono/diheme cytochrome c family protein